MAYVGRAACDVRRATRNDLRRTACAVRLAPCALLLLFAGLAGRAEAQVIDRVLAVVDQSIITLSDTLAALRLGLVSVPPDQDPIVGAVDRLIQRSLILSEVDRYATPPPPDTEVDRQLGAIRARLGSPAALDRVLAESGLTLEALRRQVEDGLRIEAYLEQRFPRVLQQPTDDELLQYYQAHPTEFSRGGTARPFGEVANDVRRAFIESRRAAQIQEWIEGLRRRATITVLASG